MFRAFLAHHQEILYCLVNRSLSQTKVWSCGMVSSNYSGVVSPSMALSEWKLLTISHNHTFVCHKLQLTMQYKIS
jgi:hypothetical protein